MKIRTRGNQAFNVPNDDEGRGFLKLLRKFRNRGWYYRARGRGPRKEHGCQQSIGQEHSEWMAVYLEDRQEKPQTSFTVFNNVRLSDFSVPTPVLSNSDSQVQITINPTQPLCGCDPAAGFQCVTHLHTPPAQTAQDFIVEAPPVIRWDTDPASLTAFAPAEQKPLAADEVELTGAEQAVLDEIFHKLHNEYAPQEWDQEKQDTFYSLYGKLVD